MAPDGVSTCLFDVSCKETGGVLKLEFGACGFDPEHSEHRDDRDDRERDDHLCDGEPALLRRCFAVGFHLREYLRQGRSWPSIGKSCSGGDYVQICGFAEGPHRLRAATCYLKLRAWEAGFL